MDELSQIPAVGPPQPNQPLPPANDREELDAVHNPQVVQVGDNTSPLPPPIVPIDIPEPEDIGQQDTTTIDNQSYAEETATQESVHLSKKVILMVLLVNLILISAALILFMKSRSTLILTPYEVDNYSLLVPEDYEQKSQEAGVRFEEEDDPQTQSAIIVLSQQYPGELTEEDKTRFIDLFREQVPDFLQGFADSSDEKIENITTERIITAEKNAVRIKATIRNGDTHADFEMIVIFGNKGLYAAAVAAHESDTSLKELSGTILNSLTIYD